MIRKTLAVGIVLLFIVSSVSPMVVGNSELELMDDSNNLKSSEKTSIEITEEPTDHIWPQQGYNKSHIGRSPYSTADNLGIEKWRFPAGDWCDGSPSIGPDGVIYFGSDDRYLYAVYPNGTLKWKFRAYSIIGDFGSHPAIADDGTVYIASVFQGKIQAVNPNGTEKWAYSAPEIDTSITIGDDGIIYYGHRGDGVDARYPNGTLKWRFVTDGCVMSTPAVDENNIVYFGAHDNYIYAVHSNGTLKWKYHTGEMVHASPTIASDGTIYCGSGDNYVYAFYPNGTLKWKTNIGSCMRSSPSLDKDGNLYFGVADNRLYSLDPDGNIRWSFTIGNNGGVWGSTAAISDDGTVYIGSNINFMSLGGGEIIALDLDGNLLWRKTLCDCVVYSSPVIGEDGTVYICSSNSGWGGDAWGYLHAFGPGNIKQIELEYPEPGYLYFFGIKLLPTPQGKTFILGSCNVKVNVQSEDELECVNFYIDDTLQFSDDEPPFEWRINKRFSDNIFYSHLLIVKGKYKGGCEWAEELYFRYLHIRNN